MGTSDKPDKAGAYWAKCDEAGDEWYPVEIAEVNGELMADDPCIGVYPLDHYHDGLTGLLWRKDGPV